jgi:hypothetical protein
MRKGNHYKQAFCNFYDNKSQMRKLYIKKGVKTLSKSKSEQEREWTVRKQDQNPHGKIKSLKDISKEMDKGKS